MSVIAGGALMMAMSPFRPDGSPDTARMEELARDAASHGFSGFVVAGGAGELADLTGAEVVELVAAAASGIGPKSVLAVGIYARSGASKLSRELAMAGAQALLCFADPEPESDADAGLAELLEENALGAGLKIIVDHDGGRYTAEGLRVASERHPNLVVKWGAPDLREWGTLRAQLPAVAAWFSGGGDDLAPGFAAQGADGFTSTAANIAPDAIAVLQQLIANGRLREAGEWVASHLQPLASLRSSRPGYVPAVTKAAMGRIGRAAGEPRIEARRFDDVDDAELATAVAALRGGVDRGR